jgi:radical SAM superfamily enzyme YgiQ (UPF0313 family)
LGVDHFVLNEAEKTLPQFINDLKNGSPKPVYSSNEYPDITTSPLPKWELLEIKKYAGMALQYSRGCPYDCEFCSITMLNGRTPRTKTSSQFINELEKIYNLGWRGPISIVDDNFIGNKKKLKTEILPAMIEWSEKRKYPLSFGTEVSINLSDDNELMDMMVKAGFNNVFVGIETTNNESLVECGKSPNLRRDLIASIDVLIRKGLIVSGGFIVGFDNDSPGVFKDQIDFIQNSGIVTAMVGLLVAPTGTKLYKRLESENRLLNDFATDNTNGSTNFIPRMNYGELIAGYSGLVKTIYSQKEYYQRLKHLLTNYKQPSWNKNKIKLKEIRAFIMLIWLLGTLEKGKKYFWKLLVYSLFRHLNKFQLAMTMAVYGYHFRKVAAKI